MSYIIRVVGYNAFYTNDNTPGNLWSTDISEAFKFDTKEDPTKIVESGQNMEVVEYADALDYNGSAIPDWDEIDRVDAELKKRKQQQEAEEQAQQAVPVEVEVLD